MSSPETVLHFLDRINQPDVDKLAELMTEDHIFSAGGTIAAKGKLSPESKWRTPAAWLAVVDKDLVKEWRVYADNKSVYDIANQSARS
jgi:ketosteroid isomerase-like protein